MTVLVVADGHYYLAPDGMVYSDSVYDYKFYERYLMAFDHVYAVVRIEHVSMIPTGMLKCSGEGVSFLELPAYTGPIQYAVKYFKVIRCIRKYRELADCALFRLPSATANIFCKKYVHTKKPFAVELVIDPWENFARGSIDSLLRPLIRQSWTKLTKKMCMNAAGVSYVTKRYLQLKYPCKATAGKGGFTASYSSVELPDDQFGIERVYTNKETWYISHIANTFSDYGKGHKQLLNAVRLIRDNGFDVRIKFIGDGPKRQEFSDYAKSLGIESAVEFLGKLSGSTLVKAALAETDLFVFPTKAEGLPRSLLEAMSEALPCLSSPVCGIPEILEYKYLFAYNDDEGFAKGIIRFITNPDLMTNESRRNLRTAKQYAKSKLDIKRMLFYQTLKDETQRMIGSSRG